ncbi:MAG: bifunctional DNA primase/polymerase [Bifidobacteriaceae bacterium]|nr:bifunctional DNA primase/polymerase [Bifidobacteriaceae bacterium]
MNTRAEVVIAAQRLPLREAAPFLAANGVPVFPCREAGKSPIVRHGLLAATVDVGGVERWWSRWPAANIAMPTGPASGFDVVDVDVRGSGSGYEWFDRACARLRVGDWALRVLTPSGGAHFYYPTQTGRSQPSWVSAKTQVDFRGAGGYVVLPPSVGADGHGGLRPYTLVGAGHGASPVDGDKLRGFLEPERARPRSAARRVEPPVGARAGALRAWVASRTEGERNAGLFWAACRMAEAGHSFDTTVEALAPAAEHCGLAAREIAATVRSAHRRARPAPAIAAQPDESRPVAAGRQAAPAI